MGTPNTKKKKKSRKNAGRGSWKQFLPYLFIILIAAALIVAVIFVTGRRGINENRKPSAVELDKTSAPNEMDKSRLEKDSNTEIAQLLQRYFQAKKSADVDEMNKIVVTGRENAFDKESMEMEAKYTESYSNISYYVTPGIVENTYIVFVCYDEKFIGIDTKAPSMRRLYICQDEDGGMFINLDRQSWSDEVNTYMEEVSGWEEVRALTTDVNTRFQEACASDSKLNDFVRMLNGETEETAAGEESSQEPESGEKQTEQPDSPEETAEQ